MKKTLIASLLLSVVAFAAPSQAEPLKLRISGENPGASADLIMAKTFGDKLKEKLGDDFSFEFFHTGALGDEVVHMQMVRSGQIDVYPMGSDAIQLDKNWGIFDVPFLFADRETVARVLDGKIGEELRASMRKRAGLEVLAFGELGFRQITNNVRPVVKPEDMKGIKLRVPGNRARVLMFETYGAAPVSMNLSELYLALQNGTVDGQENPMETVMVNSLHEVQKNLAISKHVYTPVTLVMNAGRFEKLSDDQKKAVREAAQEAAEHVRSLGEKIDAEAVEKLKSEGKVAVTEIDLAAFQEASKPVWEALTPTLDDGLLDRVNAEIAAQ